ncbi:hypothetical protein HYV88_01435 [Candidatus Woesearchaeota archaeon]|nr:hypothetical protein [Candidatus Woesearchaeota archaeon]
MTGLTMPGCTSRTDNSELPFNYPQCSDTIDNDRDGYVDFPADPGCLSRTDNSEIPFNYHQCNNGLDDDNDGFIDYPADLGCSNDFDDSELPFNYPQCNDGYDNDGDGLIDYPADLVVLAEQIIQNFHLIIRNVLTLLIMIGMDMLIFQLILDV